MQIEQITDYISSLSDEDLTACFDEAVSDCSNAAEIEPESERHQECFAAVMYYAFEMTRRGLLKPVIH